MQTKSMAFSRSLRPLPLQSGWERSTDLEITYSLLAQTFSVTTPSCRTGSSVPTSFSEDGRSPGLISIQQRAWPTADPQVPSPSSFLCQGPIQGVAMCESTVGEMNPQ